MKNLICLRLISVASILLGAASLASAQSLGGNWRFDEGAGVYALDSSGNGNVGQLSSGSMWVPGRYGTALRFASSGFVRVVNSPALEPSSTLTIEAWVRHLGHPGVAGEAASIAAKGACDFASFSPGSYGLFSPVPGGLQFFVSTNLGGAASPDAGPGVWDGNWHLVAGTYDGAMVRLFVDGSEIGSGTPFSGEIRYRTLMPNDLFVGSRLEACPISPSRFIGDIDELKIWRSARSACAIADEYKAALSALLRPFLLELMSGSGRFNTFIGLLQEAGLTKTLEAEKAVTVFAPNDDAFAAMPAGMLASIRKDPAKLRAFLAGFIIRGRLPVLGLAYVPASDYLLMNLNGVPITVSVECHPGGCNLGNDNAGRILRADVEGGNGFVNEIDRISFRPIFNPPVDGTLPIL